MSDYTGFKSSIASLRVAPASAPALDSKDLSSTAVKPISPPESAGSDAAPDAASAAKDGARWVEDYDGGMRFAPIKEHIVSRAMTKRYAEGMYDHAISDVVISALLSARSLDKNTTPYSLSSNPPQSAPVRRASRLRTRSPRPGRSSRSQSWRPVSRPAAVRGSAGSL